MAEFGEESEDESGEGSDESEGEMDKERLKVIL